MKRILISSIAFVIISNCAVSCTLNPINDLFVNILLGNTTAALKDVGDIIQKPLTDQLSVIGRSSFPETVNMFGHNCEDYDVITDDGYILKLWRIPGNVTKPVLLVHGNSESGFAWLHRGKISMSVTLADKGYDVWVINLRGSTSSRRHKYLDPVIDSVQFFNFTFYEWGLYDMAATIDFILKETSQANLTVIGHSQGSSDMFVLGSERPEYNDKVRLSVNLAPVATFRGLPGVAVALNKAKTLANQPVYSVADGGQEVLGHEQVGSISQAYCFDPRYSEMCLKLIYGSTDRDERGMDVDFLFTFLGHYPAGTSSKLSNHIYQIACRKKFSKYDYGKKRNLEVYHSVEPPDIDLSKVTMKTALIFAKHDAFSSLRVVNELRVGLPNVVHYQVMPYEHFNHLDFIVSRYMAEQLYPIIFKLLQKYS